MRFDLFWVLMGRTAYVFAPIYLIPFGYGFVLGDPLAGSFLALGVLTAILGMVFGNMGRSHMRQLSSSFPSGSCSLCSACCRFIWRGCTSRPWTRSSSASPRSRQRA